MRWDVQSWDSNRVGSGRRCLGEWGLGGGWEGKGGRRNGPAEDAEGDGEGGGAEEEGLARVGGREGVAGRLKRVGVPGR